MSNLTADRTCGQGEEGEATCRFNLKIVTGGAHAINDKVFEVGDISKFAPFLDLIAEHAVALFTDSSGNTVHEFVINNGPISHVYHQHINPFQVQEAVGTNGFIALQNTWWDTLGNYGGSDGASNNITARMWTRGNWVSPYFLGRDFFGSGGGLIIVHCHLLQHEDKGMMRFYGIQGKLLDESDTITEVDDDIPIYVVLGVLSLIVLVLLVLGLLIAHFRKKQISTKEEDKIAGALGHGSGSNAAPSRSTRSVETEVDGQAGTAEMTEM